MESKACKIRRAQQLRPIPGQVPPGQKTQVQGSPGDAGAAAIIPGRPDLKRQGHLGRQAPDGQVPGRPGGQVGQGARQLPLPAGPVLLSVPQGKRADLHGDQAGPQVRQEFHGPGIPPGVPVDRADEDEIIIGVIGPDGVFPRIVIRSTLQARCHIRAKITGSGSIRVIPGSAPRFFQVS